MASAVGAIRLTDIFDAYDQESAVEQAKHEDSIDPAALAAEIGGDEIAKDVIRATSGIADSALIQLGELEEVTNKGDDAPEEEEKKDEKKKSIDYQGNNLRVYELPPEKADSEQKISLKAFRYTDDIWNTHNTYHRTINNGFDDDDTEPNGHFSDIVGQFVPHLSGAYAQKPNRPQHMAAMKEPVDKDTGIPERQSKENIKKMNEWRAYEKMDVIEKEAARNKVYHYTDDISNTHSVKPAAINNGFDDSEVEPVETLS